MNFWVSLSSVAQRTRARARAREREREREETSRVVCLSTRKVSCRNDVIATDPVHLCACVCAGGGQGICKKGVCMGRGYVCVDGRGYVSVHRKN